MRDLNELGLSWDRPPAPVTEESIREFESVFNVRLPESYKALLRHSNGGYPRVRALTPKGYPPDMHWSIYFFFLGSPPSTDWDWSRGYEEAAGLWWNMETRGPEIGPGVVPIGGDAGGDIVFIDTSAVPPAVGLYLYDEEESMPVADTFEDFVNMLVEPPDD